MMKIVPLISSFLEVFFLTLLLSSAGGNAADSRIIGGNSAEDGEFPHQVYVEFHSPISSWRCGGTLISEWWVLTAAHCCEDANHQTATSAVVLAGSNRWNSAESVPLPADKIIPHHDYNPYIGRRNDICVVSLSIPTTGIPKTAPIALPNDANDDPAPDDPVTLSGWGKVSDDTHQESDELLKVQVPVIYNEDCRMEYPLDEYEGVICVDTVNGTMGICNGDQGGPMNKGTGAPYPMVSGVGSFVDDRKGCEGGKPHVFTRVSYFRDWIRDQTSI